jgi:hypothetical protein
MNRIEHIVFQLHMNDSFYSRLGQQPLTIPCGYWPSIKWLLSHLFYCNCLMSKKGVMQ